MISLPRSFRRNHPIDPIDDDDDARRHGPPPKLARCPYCGRPQPCCGGGEPPKSFPSWPLELPAYRPAWVSAAVH